VAHRLTSKNIRAPAPAVTQRRQTDPDDFHLMRWVLDNIETDPLRRCDNELCRSLDRAGFAVIDLQYYRSDFWEVSMSCGQGVRLGDVEQLLRDIARKCGRRITAKELLVWVHAGVVSARFRLRALKERK
jgi:hypothetical protein